MFVTAKTVIKTYGRLSKVAEDIEKIIKDAALGSFGSTQPAICQAEKILDLIEKKNLLVNLKLIARKALKALTEEEFDILASRYGRSKKELYLSRRTYFRRVRNALRAFSRELAARGITREVFENDYAGKVHFLQVERQLVLNEEKACNLRISTLKLSRAACRGGSLKTIKAT